MLEFFSNKKVSLIAANKPIFDKLAEYDNMLTKLNGIIHSDGLVYPKDGSWNQKIKFILSINQEGLKIREIVDAVANYEGAAKGSGKWTEIYKGVAPSLSAGDKLYQKITNEEGGAIYKLIK